MIHARDSLLARVCRDPLVCREFELRDWDLLVRQARTANVLARLAVKLSGAGELERIPLPPRRHLMSAATVAARHRDSVLYEASEVVQALHRLNLEPILLKGAGYTAARLDAALGRLYGDIDILVPKERLQDVESELLRAGWRVDEPEPYNQRYYRQWMHELPPLRHMRRGTTLDVHHTILPPTAGRRLDPRRLFERSQAASHVAGARVLDPMDRIIHSATHLFFDGELEHGFRDLVDLDSLVREWLAAPRVVPAHLWARARELDLERPLFYGLRYSGEFLGSPTHREGMALPAAGPNKVLRALMDALFLRALAPRHPSCSNPITPMATAMLYLRAHWLRMPPHLLAYHLARKAMMPTSKSVRDGPEPVRPEL